MTQNVKRTLLTCALALITLAAFPQTESSIIGQWKDIEQPDRQMEFYLDKDGLYYAKAVNDKSKESINGKVLVKKLKFDEATKTFKGLMSPPDAKLELNVTISFSGQDKLKIVAKKFVMTKTRQLVRIK
jgi:hypothetical protein